MRTHCIYNCKCQWWPNGTILQVIDPYSSPSHAHLYVVIEEVRLQVVDTELQGAQTLVDESLGAVEGGDQRVHEHVQVGQQGAESDGYREAKLHKQILHVLLVLTTLEAVQTWERVWLGAWLGGDQKKC